MKTYAVIKITTRKDSIEFILLKTESALFKLTYRKGIRKPSHKLHHPNLNKDLIWKTCLSLHCTSCLSTPFSSQSNTLYHDAGSPILSCLGLHHIHCKFEINEFILLKLCHTAAIWMWVLGSTPPAKLLVQIQMAQYKDRLLIKGVRIQL